MTNAEHAVVQAFNTYFATEGVRGVAYRRKQAHYTGQECDILVDSPYAEYYLAIESKSFHINNTPKLYFTQHFHTNERDQIKRIQTFLYYSGRTGYLALEVRQGRGHPNALYLIPWPVVMALYADQTGIAPADVSAHHIPKEQGYYAISTIFRKDTN